MIYRDKLIERSVIIALLMLCIPAVCTLHSAASSIFDQHSKPLNGKSKPIDTAPVTLMYFLMLA